MEIELLGHKAKVERIGWEPALEPWYKEDQITAWLKLDEPVDGTIGFGVTLPSRDYTEEEFKAEVKSVGEEHLNHWIKERKVKAAEDEIREEKRKVMNKRVADLGDKLGTEYTIRER